MWLALFASTVLQINLLNQQLGASVTIPPFVYESVIMSTHHPQAHTQTQTQIQRQTQTHKYTQTHPHTHTQPTEPAVCVKVRNIPWECQHIGDSMSQGNPSSLKWL